MLAAAQRTEDERHVVADFGHTVLIVRPQRTRRSFVLGRGQDRDLFACVGPVSGKRTGAQGGDIVLWRETG